MARSILWKCVLSTGTVQKRRRNRRAISEGSFCTEVITEDRNRLLAHIRDAGQKLPIGNIRGKPVVTARAALSAAPLSGKDLAPWTSWVCLSPRGVAPAFLHATRRTGAENLWVQGSGIQTGQ